MEANKKIKKGKNFTNIIGKNIRYYRKIKGYNLKDLAQKLGVSAQQLQKYETGNNRISAEKLFEVSKILNVSLNNFYRLISKNNINDFKNPDINNLIDYYSQISSNDVRKLILQNTILFANFGA
ncbi:MAG: helix-turn-helix transcriptional regulator [Rickettsiales bacterium]|nr:helix-turn-helix transcriptional regulator [Rickettsiales bacterium]